MSVDPGELRRLRNTIPIFSVVTRLSIPTKKRDGITRFLCPICSEFNTAINPQTNLARCFRCEKSFNPIDLVMSARKTGFKEAVAFLTRCQNHNTPTTASPDAGHKIQNIGDILAQGMSQIPTTPISSLEQVRLSHLERRLNNIEHQVVKITRFLNSPTK